MLTQSEQLELAEGGDASERVPIEAYLRYRDSVLELMQEGFASTAFETGRILARKLKHERESQVRGLLRQFEHAQNKLPAIGQAAVLASRGSPGTVEARMKGDLLQIVIRECPECRGLQRSAPFCYVNQGVITEFAASYLGLAVDTREVVCAATGGAHCEIEVTL